jgi:diguanylate cyclase (GGDEF)-like protein
LDEVVGQRIDMEAEVQNRLNALLTLGEDIHKQVGSLRGKVRPETPDWELADSWADSASTIVLNTNSMLGISSKSRLEKVAIQLDDLWQEAEAQYKRMTPDLRLRLAPLRKILAENTASPPSFMTKRLQLLDAEQLEGGMVSQAEILASQLVTACADLFFKTQSEVEKQNTRVSEVIGWTSKLQVATVAITFLVALIILLYINQSVIRRIMALRNAMTDHAQGREGAVEIAGHDEIGDMARALNYFIQAIKDREDKLQAINADLTLAHHRLEKLAITDRLTGLYNRNKLDEVFAYELAQAERYGKPLSIIMADIDKFKSVNDTYGHQVGDSVLCDFAAIMRELARDTDTPGRWGGEEFLIICSHVDLNGAQILAERIRAAIDTHSFSVVGHKTSSFGVSSYRPKDTSETMVKRADDALYEAKENGRNRVVLEHGID